ncbi:ABC transporter permease subunit [Streptomyces sp. NPDC058872]|uniref:ABC transporter permease subunit n=1 Tax=Streptomyces sp. NPDC058872 TaxID=3346661 RepID=UPI00367CD76B
MISVLTTGALRALRRSWLTWAVSIIALIVLTTAFWPAFENSPDMSDLTASMPEGLVQALGIGDLGSPEGFLWGNLYALLVPLLMAVAAASFTTTLTARQEESGQYELLLTQPVSRTAVLTSRALAVLAATLALGLTVFLVQWIADLIWDLGTSVSRLLSTVVLCALTALVAAAASLVTAAVTSRPSAALGAGVGLTVAGYVVSALFPLREGWKDFQYLSPWNWALGGEPLTHAAEWWRYAAPVGLALLLAVLAPSLFDRRDVHAP